MRRNERFEIPSETFLHVLENFQSQLNISMPGIVVSFDNVALTLKIQPAINRIYTDPKSGKQTWIKMPMLLDVPLILYGGGGMTLTCPINPGDECLVFFSDRCIDSWWQNGCPVVNNEINTQNQAEFRMHDLSDGFAIVGLRSQPRKIPNYSTTSMQLRSDDGLTVIDMNNTTHSVTITASNVTITNDCTINGRDFMNHTHSNVQSGSSNSGGVV